MVNIMIRESLRDLLPLAAQTTYADLLTRLEEEAVLEVEGTPVLRTRRGRQYWYAVRRLGDRTVERYLGPDTPDLRTRIGQLQTLRDDVRLRAEQRGCLVRMCRAGGIPGVNAATGKVLHALSKAGVFRLRCVIVGTHAFRCYPGILGARLPVALAVTEDIGIAASRTIAAAPDDHLDPALGKALAAAGPFAAQPGLHRQPTAWRDRRSGVQVELLAPDRGPERDAPIELPALGAHARPLRFLDYLIHAPIQAAALYRSGILVNIPQPARYAIHKLIIATRRHLAASAKAEKDLAQAAALIRVLADGRPDELEDAYREARERGPAWRGALAAGAQRLPPDARTALADSVRRVAPE